MSLRVQEAAERSPASRESPSGAEEIREGQVRAAALGWAQPCTCGQARAEGCPVSNW